MTGPRLKTFLSYASERADQVREVHRFIEAVGVDSWFDKESLVGGDAWDKERLSAQKSADLFLAMISNETLSRDGVIHREINDALVAAKDRLPGRLYIVPLRLDAVDLPEGIGGHHAINLFESNWKGHLARTFKKAAQQYGRSVCDALEVAAATQASGGALSREHEEEDQSGRRFVRYFQYGDAGPYWDYVNAEILKAAYGGLFSYRRMMADWPEDRQPSDWECQIDEFHRRGVLVSLTIGETDYFGQTPHPNHRLTTINIFGEQCGRIGIGELFDHAPAAFKALTAYCEFNLQQPGQHFDGEDISLDHYAETYGWDLFQHFNVNERGLILNFSAASGLPHVLGVFEVYVPWESVAAHIPGSVREFLTEIGMPLK